MRCFICDEADKWKNVDNFRMKSQKLNEKTKKLEPVGMEICMSCGVVSYPSRYQSPEAIKEYYRNSYRAAPSSAGLFTGERKLQYHEFFLKPLFESWKDAGITKPVIGEVGSAFGMFLNWVRGKFPEADLHGTELTKTYRRIAYHEYGLKIEEDFDTSKKYDLIVSYHVLEHQVDPDKMLKQYADCLKETGVFYLACPIWFREIANGASVPGFDLDYYWAPDHINSWSEKHLEYLIAKAGLEIVYKNDDIYGNTYILKRTTKEAVKPEFKPEENLKFVEMIKDLAIKLQENKTKECIETYPNFPPAWINHYEFNRAEFHKSREELDKFLHNAIQACPNSSDTMQFVADVLTRYERYDEAFDVLSGALKKRPNHTTILQGIANCYRMKALKEQDPAKKKVFLKKSIDVSRFILSISSEALPQVLTWIYRDEAELDID